MTGDPTRDREATPHDFESLPVDEYAAAKTERYRKKRQDMDAAHEKAKAERERCPDSARIDGPWHSWRFDGDDPYIVCVFCGKRNDALTGLVLTAHQPCEQHMPGFFNGVNGVCGRPSGHDDDCWPVPLAADRTEGEG